MIPPQGTVLISRPGSFNDAEVVRVASPVMSWRTDGPGTFDCLVETRMMAELGMPVGGRTNLLGRWLYYDHATAGPWAGVITGADPRGPMTTLFAESFAVLLRKRKLGSNLKPLTSTSGSLAMYLVKGAERRGENIGLTGYGVDEGGDIVSYEPRAGDMCDQVLPELASYGYQWRVRSNSIYDRTFEFRYRLGPDNRGTVLLSDGRHFQADSFTMSTDLWQVSNAIEGISGERSFSSALGYVLEDRKSLKELGRRYEETVILSGVATRSTIAPLVKLLLKKKRYAPEIVTVDVLDEDLCWREFREGDTISVISHDLGFKAPMEIDVRTLDVDRAVMTIAGELITSEAVY